MKTVNFTNKSIMSWLAMAMLCMFAVGANAQVCTQDANVTLVVEGDICEVMIDAADLAGAGAIAFTKVIMIEKGPHYTGPLVKVLEATDPNEVSVFVSAPGKYKYEVAGGCWGTFNVEDKTAPVCIVPDGDEDTDADHIVDGKSTELGTLEDDLATEVVSCTADEATIARYFDVLEADDFMDCSDLKDHDVYSVDFKWNVCSELQFGTGDDQIELPAGISAPIIPAMDQTLFQICEVRLKVWGITDWSGKPSSNICGQFVFVVRPILIFVDMNPTAECGTIETLGSGAPFMFDVKTSRDDDGDLELATDFTKKISLEAGQHTCKFAASYHADPIIETCRDKEGCKDNGTYKEARHWTVVDWCTGAKMPALMVTPNSDDDADIPGYDVTTPFPVILDELTQIASVSDTQAPELPATIAAPSYWGNPWNCDIEVKLSDIIAVDSCQGNVTADFDVSVIGRNAHGETNFYEVYTREEALAGFNAPEGAMITVLAQAWDCCGNTSLNTYGPFEVSVVDVYAPICISNDELEVSLINIEAHDNTDPSKHEVGARIYPEDLDDTSKDNCAIDYMKIRKAAKHVPGGNTSLSDTEGWEDYIDYSNIDDKLDLAGGEKCSVEVWVDLLVVDKAGNYSICPSRLILRDNTTPVISDIDAHQIYACTDHTQPAAGGISIWGNCYDDDDKSANYEFHCPVTKDEALEKAVELTQELVYDLSGDEITLAQAEYILLKADASAVLSSLWYNSVDVSVYFVSKKSEHGASHDFAATATFEYSVEKETFVFPQDKKVECDMIPDALGDPETTTYGQLDIDDIIVVNDGCSEWVMNVSQKVFRGADDACLKIIRNYEFINWCRWDENLTNDNTQIDKYCADNNDEDGNGDGKLTEPNEVVAISFDKAKYTQMPKGGGCNEDESKLGYRRYSDVSLVANGYFNYTQIIKINDNIKPEVELVKQDQTCTFDCDLPYTQTMEFMVTDECSTGAITEVKLDAFNAGTKTVITKDVLTDLGDGKYQVVGDFPTGTHTLHLTIEDQCGNYNFAAYEFKIGKECKKPTPVAVAVFTALMDDADCTVDIWASDLEQSSFDECSDVVIAIEKADDEDGVNVVKFEDDKTNYADYQSVTFDASEAGTQRIAFWVRDAAGNEQYAITYIEIRAGDCAAAGEPRIAVAGKIVNENDEDIDQVTISAQGSDMTSFTSIFDGVFNLSSVPMNSDVTISAEKNVGHLNGVSTADLVLLQRHVLGISTLNSAYKIIAADANNDTKIDTRDMLHISRLVLGIYDELPNNTSWRFVSKDYTFANPTSPWGFAEAVDFQNLEVDAQADFIGIKIGDLSGNAVPTKLLGTDDTKVGTMNIAIDDATIAAGETRTIEFTTADFNNFAGYQFSIALDSRVSFDGVTVGALEGLTEANFGLSALESGVITTNWSNVEGVSVENGTVMFSLTVTASEAVNVSEILAVNSAVTPAEAYNADLDVHNVAVKFNRAANAAFELFQNTPNPVSGETVIGFNLPTAGAATLKVMDVAGRTIFAQSNDFAAGYNTIALNKSDLNATGVLYYQLDTENNSATKKMVILD